MDFNEIMDHCGFDLEKADAMAKEYKPILWMQNAVEEALNDVGLEKIQPESV